MPAPRLRARGAHLAAPPAVLALCLVLGACGGSAATASSSRSASAVATVAAAAVPGGTPEPPCAANTDGEVARATAIVARRIYELELGSGDVRSDQRQVAHYAPLLGALAANNRAGVEEAVNSLVFSHTHIVRLRVLRGGKVLADVGGPYILAPVGGALRSGGRTVGRYLLSVQDDSGYQKLESRYIGYQLVMRIGGRALPVEGTLGAGAASLPSQGPAAYHGKRYRMVTFAATAFPSGTLHVSLLVPASRPSALSCRVVRARTLAGIGRRVWGRFLLVGAPAAAGVREVHSLTNALVFVRAGATQLAGSSRPGPAHLPVSGAVRYNGHDYLVSSFQSHSGATGVRVYLLLALS